MYLRVCRGLHTPVCASVRYHAWGVLETRECNAKRRREGRPKFLTQRKVDRARLKLGFGLVFHVKDFGLRPLVMGFFLFRTHTSTSILMSFGVSLSKKPCYSGSAQR